MVTNQGFEKVIQQQAKICIVMNEVQIIKELFSFL
jgi:hypothetical protein